MSIWFNKRTKRYEVRIQHLGSREYVGSFKTKKRAEVEYKEAEKRLEKLKSYTLDNYKITFEKPRRSKHHKLMERFRMWVIEKRSERGKRKN